jgi:hypothetical protein
MSGESAAERSAENESFFRNLNDNIDEFAARLGTETEVVCECDRPGCVQLLGRVRRDLYERVRAHPRRFFVKPGHERAGLERVVERQTRFYVVEKLGEAGEAADRWARG